MQKLILIKFNFRKRTARWIVFIEYVEAYSSDYKAICTSTKKSSKPQYFTNDS